MSDLPSTKHEGFARKARLAPVVFILLASSTVQSQDAREIARKVLPSVVLIKVYDRMGQELGVGSGFLVKSDVVATNFHVIKGAFSAVITVVGSNRTLKVAGIVASDEKHDLALIKLESQAGSPLTLAQFSDVEIGEDVYVFGNPRGLEGSISSGLVSSKGTRLIEGEDLIQITAPISPGSSGGPVVNRQGQVIGVASASFRGGQNLNFAVPAPFLSLLMANIHSTLPMEETSQSTRYGVAPSGTSGSAAPSGWLPFTSNDGRFSILTPSKPTVEVKEIDSAVGKLTMYAYSSSNATGFFMIMFGDYPKEPTDAAQTLRVLEGVRSGVVKGLQGELTSDESVAFDGYPGREFKAKRVVENSEVIFRWKIVLVGRRLYQIAAATTPGQAESPELTKFFSSFQLKK